MKSNKHYCYDLSGICLGVEHYYECDEDGNIYDCRTFESYVEKEIPIKMVSSDIKRRLLINFDMGHEIIIDQDGKCHGCDSDERELLEVTQLHSLKDCLINTIENIRPIMGDIVDGIENLQNLEYVRDFILAREKDNEPAYMEKEEYLNFFQDIDSIYYLAYGDPISKMSKEDCIKSYYNHAIKKSDPPATIINIGRRKK